MEVKNLPLILSILIAAAPALAQPAVTLSPLSHDYGPVDVGSSKEHTFRVMNPGSDTLEAFAYLFEGIHFEFTPITFELPPGGFRDLVVALRPVRPGEMFDSLLVTHNAPGSANPLGAWLTGLATPRPQIAVRPESFDFGTVAVRTSAETTFWISNPGSGLVTVRASISSGSPQYALTTTGDLFTVAAGDSVPVIVEFGPTQVGPKSGQLKIDHNGRNRPTPIFVALNGAGSQAVTIDKHEPNNSAAEATPIETGAITDSTEIWPQGDVDYFVFDGIYGEWLTITVDIPSGSTLNGKVWLYDPEGNLIAENDNFEGSNDVSQIQDTLRASGKHYVRVAFAGNSGDFPNAASGKTQGEDPTGDFELSIVRTGSFPLGTPSLVAPADSVFNERVDPRLSWTSVPGARTYDVVVARSADFAPGSIVFQSTRTDTAVVAGKLPAGSVLFWRVRAGYELGPGTYTSSRFFQTTFAPVVVAPIADVLLPTGSTEIDLRPVFADPETGALSYEVISLSDSSVVEAEVQANSRLVLTVIGSGATEVNVGATDPKGASVTTSFGVIAGEATSSESDELPGDELAIGRNYPNPFTATTTVPVSVPDATEIRLQLFDLRGLAVRTIHAGAVSPGLHEFSVSSDGLAPGVYSIRLEAGDQRRTSFIVVTR